MQKKIYTTSLNLFDDKNVFFNGMKQDYKDLSMEEKGVSLKNYEKIMLDLKS